MPPTSTRLLPLWVASPSSSEPQQPPPWPPQQTQQQQTTSSQPSTSTKSSQNANPPWDRTTSTPSGQHHPSKSVNLGGGNQIVHNSGFSLADEEGNNHLVQRLSSRLTTHRAKVEEPNFSIERSMYSGQDIFFNIRMFVGLWWAAGVLSGGGLGRELCWCRRMGIRVEFFNGISVGMSGYCGLSFSVGRECCLCGSFGRYRGLLS